MLVQLDGIVERGVLTVAPTAASRGWNLEWLQALAARPRHARRRARTWTLVPDFREALEHGAGGRGDGAGDRLVPHRRRRDARLLGHGA